MAEATAFLLSSKSKWMTGQVLGIDGGISSLRVK
jgi:NAD(P)-dependent dehydrogenase (short-subunit alcohol dehydrogenase family)